MTTAGGSASRESQRLALLALDLERQFHATRDKSGRFRAGADGERRVARALRILEQQGWRLLFDRAWPGTRSSNVDVLAVGPAGVFVIDVKVWRDAPQITSGHLLAGSQNRDAEVGKLRAMMRPIQEALEAAGLAPAGVHGFLVLANHRVDEALGQIRLAGITELLAHMIGRPQRLGPADVDTIAAILESVYPEMLPDEFDATLPAHPAEGELTAGTLFDVDTVAHAALRAELAAPMERWMTFLDPAQLKTVRRHWNGPARIAGAAGTGKSVVGLHRALHLAQSATGTILLTTYVASLPKVHQQLIGRMRPDLAGRIECVNMHAWARNLLDRRGLSYHLDARKAESEFSRALLACQLRDSALPPHYWRDEITYVIKGQGLTSFDEYATRPRPGRRVPLGRAARADVWDLYTDYQERLAAKGLHDHADLLLMALAELDRETETGIGAVLIDEVQDLTLTGIRIAHRLVGDRPNGLLLIGDVRQTVYPGGYRLADAGFTVRGRAEVLTVNYRNGSNILETGLEILSGHEVEDIDDTVASGRPQLHNSYAAGQVILARAQSRTEHDTLMIAAITALNPDDLANSAVLCLTNDDVDTYRKQLSRASIIHTPLDRYDGTPTPGIKIGTVQRGKGLEFRHVFLPHHDRHIHNAQQAADAADRLPLARQQLHVAITRARDSLWMGTTTLEGQ